MERYVVVTTQYRGVFAGVLEKQGPNTVTLRDARMCVYWAHDVKGMPGLAAVGPSDECKVTFAAPKIELFAVTAILDCSLEARERWEKQPWK